MPLTVAVLKKAAQKHCYHLELHSKRRLSKGSSSNRNTDRSSRESCSKEGSRSSSRRQMPSCPRGSCCRWTPAGSAWCSRCCPAWTPPPHGGRRKLSGSCAAWCKPQPLTHQSSRPRGHRQGGQAWLEQVPAACRRWRLPWHLWTPQRQGRLRDGLWRQHSSPL